MGIYTSPLISISPEDLYIDPIILPVSGMQDQVNY
ncbi:unnamed protein product, partial [marine sediment metagenome]